MDSRAIERFADIDVAKTGNDCLVEKKQLDRRGAAGESPFKLARIEADGLGTERLEGRPFAKLCRAHEIERAEAAGVIESEPAPLVGYHDEMVVLPKLGRVDTPVARHAEMKDERVAPVSVDEAIFGSAPKTRHPRARQSLAKIIRQCSPEVRPTGFDRVDPAPSKDSRKASDSGLNFGKFGHAPRYGEGRSTPLEALMPMNDKVNFGDELVSPEEKTRRVGEVFSSVARRYDIMNDLMSGGMHRLWKDRFVNRVKPRPGEEILDMAGGTGDVAFRMARCGARVTVADINGEMLEVGKERAERRGLSGLSWKVENAEHLSFGENAFDAYTIVFGIRNVTDIRSALREAHRVLKRGGRFYCMEFSSSDWPGFSSLYEAFASNVIPRIGKAVAGDEDSYRYLVESIRRFPRPSAFRLMVSEAGFVQASAEPMLGGLVTIHSGWKI